MKIEVREVLADAYRASHKGPMLTHAVEIDEDGRATRVLCRRVDVDNLADGNSGHDRFAPPTCESCLKAVNLLGRSSTPERGK
ncbi:MAG TPA: hypothetical protein VF491_17615 [Vicinamibacterales bacterium]